jgi:hypothetical protein
MNIEFIGSNGTFKTKEADKTSFLYLPVGSPSGVMGSVTPKGGGDTKLSQDRFLLHPVVSRSPCIQETSGFTLTAWA